MTDFLPRHIIILLAGTVMLSACAVDSGDANGVTITHSARHAGGAQWQADRHCAEYGKKAVLVRKGPIQSDNLVQSNVSEFECLD